MPYNGAGVFNRVYNWVTDKNNSIPITASRVDTEDTGFATGLSNAICKDGQTTITANLPMSGFIHTGVGNASATNHYAVVSQIQNSSFNWIAGGGTADAITATYSPAVTSLVDGMELDFRATAANATTTPTFSPNGITAHTITLNGGVALVANNIPAALFEGKLRYNLANTRWELMNPKTQKLDSGILAGTTNVSGGQLGFPAVQVPSADANTLDDYEEGTFVVAMVAGTSGTITINNSFKTLSYTKIGRMVVVTGYVAVTSVASPVGSFSITGLPFTCGNTATQRAAVTVNPNGLTGGATTCIVGRVLENTTQIDLFLWTAGSVSNMAATVQAGSDFVLNVTYFV